MFDILWYTKAIVDVKNIISGIPAQCWKLALSLCGQRLFLTQVGRKITAPIILIQCWQYWTHFEAWYHGYNFWSIEQVNSTHGALYLGTKGAVRFASAHCIKNQGQCYFFHFHFVVSVDKWCPIFSNKRILQTNVLEMTKTW